jgi:hypothetical protein
MLQIGNNSIDWQKPKLLDPVALAHATRKHRESYVRFLTDFAEFKGTKFNKTIMDKRTLGPENTLPGWSNNPIPHEADYERNLGLTSKNPIITDSEWHRNAYLQAIKREEIKRTEARRLDERYEHNQHQRKIEEFYANNLREMVKIRNVNSLNQTENIAASKERTILNQKQIYILIKELKEALTENKQFIQDQKIDPKFVAFVRREIPRNEDIHFIYHNFISAVRSEFGIPRERIDKILSKIKYIKAPNEDFYRLMHEKIQNNLETSWAHQHSQKQSSTYGDPKHIESYVAKKVHADFVKPDPYNSPLLFTQTQPDKANNIHQLQDYQRHAIGQENLSSRIGELAAAGVSKRV